MKSKPVALLTTLVARPSLSPCVLASEPSLRPPSIPTLCDFAFGDFYVLEGVSYVEGQSPEAQLITTVTFAIH